ncbi:hypothetical protein [Umezawaea tangerina]|uniref:N-acetyltransferase domain-containing protein n=1 Tax=Umezawaea tangerina TaxID=84725 RepID=A0A2T0SVS9_9PSEU|nr:hypothetical protein [Umezawaea tangerina]PRY37524.1 hypothetical protein CLV43_110336 [Umezawaea tangerina]
MNTSREYLTAAAEAGLLHRTDRFVVVADLAQDPLTGRKQCLVEHVARAGHDDPTEPDPAPDPVALLDLLRERLPDCQEALVRSVAPLGPPFVPHVTYLVRPPEPRSAADPPAPGGPDGSPLVRAEEPGDRDAVADMIDEAFDRATRQHGHRPDPAAVTAAVASVLDDPARVTYVAERDSRVVGHVTLLTGATDDPTGAEYVELLDVLVRPQDDREASRRLVAAAVAHAGRLGMTLIGNVVHVADAPEHAERTLAVLRRTGWQVAHHYSWADFREAGG